MNTSTRTTRPALVAAVLVAIVSTLTAYLAMVAFGTDVLHMSPALAYVCSGVFELSLVTVALLAREAARDNRPGGILLGLTWGLSATSGVFAAWHELIAPVPLSESLGAAGFRFLVPLLAALMWHLALIGDRHLATGASWSSMRQTARMHALFLTTEDAVRLHTINDGSGLARRAVARAEARRRRARATALRTVPPAEMRRQVADWLDSLSAVADAVTDVARMHTEANNRVAGHLTARLPDPDTTDTIAAELADITADTAAGQPSRRARVAASVSGQSGRTTRTRARTSNRRPAKAARPDRTARIAVVSALLDTTPDADSTAALSALHAAGHHVTDRTARRDLDAARATQATDSATDSGADSTPDTSTDISTDTTDTTTADTSAAILQEVHA